MPQKKLLTFDKEPESQGLVSRFSDWWSKGDEEFDWFKRTREELERLPNISASAVVPNLSLGQQAKLTGQLVGSPNALLTTGVSIASGGTAGLLSKAGTLGKMAKIASGADRTLSGMSAVAQVPKFTEAMRKGEKGKALGTGLGIALGTLGAKGSPTHPDVANFPQGPKKSFTLENPSERNLANLTEEGFIPGPTLPKKKGGQIIIGDDRVPELLKGVEGPTERPTILDNVQNRVNIPYVKSKAVLTKKLIRGEDGKPILDEAGKKTYEPVKKMVPEEEFKDVFKRWATGRRSADYSSAATKKEFAHLDTLPLSEAVKDPAAVSVLANELKPYFDKKYGQLTGAGKQLGYREDYIPQMWANSKEEVDAVFGTANSRLSLKKGFEFKRVFENYNEGIEAGLTPKFEKPSDLVAFYDKHANKAIEDKNFFEYLKAADLISTKKTKGRVPLSESLFPVKRAKNGDVSLWHAPPEVEKAITSFLQADNPGLLTRIGRQLKTSALSGGIPYTGLNFHGVSIVARDAMASDKPLTTLAKDIKLLINPKAGEDFIGKNLTHTADAVRDGLQISTEHIPFRIGAASENKGFLGKTQEIFEDPLFQKAIPAMKLERYDSIRTDLIAKGLDRAEAGKIAATQTNEIFGSIDFKTMVADTRFDSTMKFLAGDNSAWFLAPQWLASQGYIAKNMAKALRNPEDPRGRVYHSMAKNLAISYTYANVTNKILSGHWMGENDRGKYFEIDTGQKDSKGKTIYIAPFGTGADFVRLPVEMAGKLIDGDSQGLSGIAKSRLGPVPQIATSALLTHEDWSGKPLKTPMDYVGLGTDYMPPYARAGMNFLSGDKSGLQSLTDSVEMPIRYRKDQKKKLLRF